MTAVEKLRLCVSRESLTEVLGVIPGMSIVRDITDAALSTSLSEELTISPMASR